MTFIVGLDPGKNGALAYYHAEENSVLGMWDIPKLTVTKRSKSSEEVDWDAYCKLLFEIKLTFPALAVIEAVHSMPKQGISSSFTFGEIYGGQSQLLAYILGCRTIRVPPVTWKRSMKVGTAEDDIFKAACNRWPERKDWWRTPRGRICHDRCEAAFLAAYGKKILEAGE